LALFGRLTAERAKSLVIASVQKPAHVWTSGNRGSRLAPPSVFSACTLPFTTPSIFNAIRLALDAPGLASRRRINGENAVAAA